jgi:hypothetical protein
MNRNYQTPAVPASWADSRQTDMAVAVAIHAISGGKRTPETIWEAPTPAEWGRVHMAVEEYVRHGDFEHDPTGYCWGQEKIHIPLASDGLEE